MKSVPGNDGRPSIVDDERAFARGLAVCGELRRKSGRGRQQLDHFVRSLAADSQQAKVIGRTGGEVNLVVGCSADGVDTGLEPLQTSQREPAIRGRDLHLALSSPFSEAREALCGAGGIRCRA